jgi:hypothetical protein
LYLGPSRWHPLTFSATTRDDETLVQALRILAESPSLLRLRSLTLERVDGLPAAKSPFAGLLPAWGFRRDYRGLIAERR